MQEKPPKKQYREILHCWLKGIIEKSNHYSNLITLFTSVVVAVATIALAIITYFQISESREMRLETKRLVDTGIEQFKIKSYPDLLIVLKLLPDQSNNFIQALEIHNKGEIIALDVTPLLVNVYGNDSQREFVNNIFYKAAENNEERNSLRNKFNISPQGFKFLELRNFNIPNKLTFDSLKGALLFIRFKVPYDTKYRYISVAYRLMKDMNAKEPAPKYLMSEMDSIDSNIWIKRYMKAIQNSAINDPNANDFKTFLKDYDLEDK